ncbi:hypothetical protein HDA45_002190 [Amycolatopsis umgeniensis]|uniref:Uncharacterized protein n=1 Tax=Amycolatopsis umgeniensis TaxID=336628 RepID=A0A841AZ37_9PSEU|nr:hypothetical protein [Amycolatopsis umgeniensis]
MNDEIGQVTGTKDKHCMEGYARIPGGPFHRSKGDGYPVPDGRKLF